MVRRSLFVAALLAVASPVSAQMDEAVWQWSSDRPDANAPLGVFGSRTLAMGEAEIRYRYIQTNMLGVWFGTDSLDLATTLALYNDAPTQSSDIRHQGHFAFGLSDQLTLVGRAEFAVLSRETVANNGLVRTSVEDIGDIEVGALYNVIASGPYRMHVQAGAMIPIGASQTMADTTAAQSGAMTTLPYDMRPGTGSFGYILGLTGSMQNEVGSIGGQFRLRQYVGNNSNGYRVGDDYEASGWAAYNVNESVSVSAGVRWRTWDDISGADATLNPVGDPHNSGSLIAGQRAMMPLGVNFRMPADSRFAGHMLSLEAVYSLHHDYEGPQLGMDWGLNFGWTLGF